MIFFKLKIFFEKIVNIVDKCEKKCFEVHCKKTFEKSFEFANINENNAVN